MNVCIVGHGPSLRGAGKGSLIDSHDIVVRLKGCRPVLTSDDYGSRVDHLCASTEIMGTFFDVYASSFWGYPKKGTYDFDRAVKAIMDLGAPVMIPLTLCNIWNDKFRSMGGKHPNVSTGMAAIIIAAHYYEPETIYLAGFDTLLDPEKSFERNNDIPRSGIGVIDHDWKTENRLLNEIEKSYNLKIEPL